MCIKLVDLLLDFAMENDFNIDVACNYQLKDCAEIIKWKNECEILNWLKELYKHGMECLSENRGNKLNRLMLQAKEFIQENYMKPICLTDIARHVHLAPNYFSTLFSKQFQKSVIEYICTLRMERAKELLQESEVKVFKVGEYAGYENPQYFSRVFKKYMGMSPSEYRRLSQIDTSQKD